MAVALLLLERVVGMVVVARMHVEPRIWGCSLSETRRRVEGPRRVEARASLDVLIWEGEMCDNWRDIDGLCMY